MNIDASMAFLEGWLGLPEGSLGRALPADRCPGPCRGNPAGSSCLHGGCPNPVREARREVGGG